MSDNTKQFENILSAQDAETSNSAVYWTSIYLDHGINSGMVSVAPFAGLQTPPSIQENKIAVELLSTIEGITHSPISALPLEKRQDFIGLISGVMDVIYVNARRSQ